MTTSAMTGLATDVEIVRRVLAHIDAGTTDEGGSWREPVRNYLDPERFAAELALLRTQPSVFVPSAAIPNAGDQVERVAFGVPLFAVRDRDGRARVFRNACRHRGVALVEGPGCSHALVCRYHGWTYRLDGSLAHVPHPDGFPGLDRAERGLVEVPSAEVDGLIVIGGVEPGPADHDQPADLGALADGTPWRDKLVPAGRMFRVEAVLRSINWKVLVEQFLEGYHIRTLHRQTFYPVQYDNLNVIETFGPNSRITYPYRAVERLRDRDESTWTIGHRVTFLYQLFPNAMIATFPDRVVLVIVDPVDVDHCRVTSYSMADPAVLGDRTGEPTEGGKLIADGLLEDNQMSEAVQRGLHSGANRFVEFGRHESAIGHFHRSLTDRLAHSSRA
jgi:phenylpropionate dioxygenase-like ring-hydroxylating dioxygenase large terminal subunit